MAEAHPVGLPVGDGGQGPRGHGDPRRPPVQPDQRARRPARADPGRRGHRVPRRTDQLRAAAARSTSATTSGLHQRLDDPAEDFADTEDLDGLFSGLDPSSGRYDLDDLAYQGGDAGAARRRRARCRGRPAARTSQRGRRAARRTARGGAAAQPGRRTPTTTLQHPRCVFQVLKRHFARYTPEMVQQVCGVPRGAVHRGRRALITENSGRERTTAFVYAVGWTQHTVGVQYIRTAAILQALLGNIGRPGGGILALRGHASIQGSTDIPTLFDMLPGYLPMPHAHGNDDLDSTSRPRRAAKGFWGEHARLHGQPAEGVVGRRGDRRERLLLRLPAAADRHHRTYETVMAQIDGTLQGLFPRGREPRRRLGQRPDAAARHGEARLAGGARLRRSSRSPTCWKDGPEIETGEMRTEDIETEVFFLPAAAHTEKDGSFTNTQRMLQWHHKAVEPAGDAAATCGSPTTSAAHPGRSWRRARRRAGDRDRWTGRCWTSPGTTR